MGEGSPTQCLCSFARNGCRRARIVGSFTTPCLQPRGSRCVDAHGVRDRYAAGPPCDSSADLGPSSHKDRMVHVEHARYLAEQIPDAKYVELPGTDHFFFTGDADAYLDQIEEFLTGEHHTSESDRVLATVLFADIAGSTERAVELGDSRWHRLLDSYYGVARRQLERFRGREIDTAGDGFFASFDGPARAIRCATAIGSGALSLGLEIRSGVHTGECEVMGSKIGGIAVHIGARVAGQAAPGEVLVSSTVKDLVAGSGIAFEDRGAHTLKGVPGEWHLYAVSGPNEVRNGASGSTSRSTHE